MASAKGHMWRRSVRMTALCGILLTVSPPTHSWAFVVIPGSGIYDGRHDSAVVVVGRGGGGSFLCSTVLRTFRLHSKGDTEEEEEEAEKPSVPRKLKLKFCPSSISAMLAEDDVESAEVSLMKAVGEVNGAVDNHPDILRCFEDLFRTRIRIARDNDQDEDEDTSGSGGGKDGANVEGAFGYGVAQDRMGLASLLADRAQYQEAADQLRLAVPSLSNLVANHTEDPSLPPPSVVAAALDKASSLLFRTRAMVCDWEDYPRCSRRLRDSTRSALHRNLLPSVHPFEALAWPSLGLEDATRIAHAYGRRAIQEATRGDSHNDHHHRHPEYNKLPWVELEERIPQTDVPFVHATHPTPNTPTDDPSLIRVGYLSPDFTGKHPLAFLMQDVFRMHDPTRFQTIFYSLSGPPDGSPEVNKILHGHPHPNTTNTTTNTTTTNTTNNTTRPWRTLEGSLPTMAKTVSSDRLDVLVDLCGYTGTARVASLVAALKSLPDPPVTVGYMGFPASAGAPYVDYMVADEVVVPRETRRFYTERVLFMPHCYFVNSHRHIRDDDDGDDKVTPCREDYGLPPHPTFVFCCHSRPDKIDPSTFQTWIRALRRTRDEGRSTRTPAMENAVLWLLRGTAVEMEDNLRKAASRTLVEDDDGGGGGGGLPDGALVFCDTAPRGEHLERLALADLFLDTPAYNAHTVGCDCLAAGVPMLSLLRPFHDRGDGDDEGNEVDEDDEDDEDDDRESVVPTEKLASRVGASLLRSATASESSASSPSSDVLVVDSMDAYEERMVDCARSYATGNGIGTAGADGRVDARAAAARVGFKELKRRLWDQRDGAPLWDTERWVRNLEVGLTTMVDRRRDGSDDVDIYVVDSKDGRVR